MNRKLKSGAIALAILFVILIALPLLINVNSFRPKIESELTSALGRQVTVGNLSLSIFSSSVVADNIAIADDPRSDQCEQFPSKDRVGADECTGPTGDGR